jgi:hypothetical protein
MESPDPNLQENGLGGHEFRQNQVPQFATFLIEESANSAFFTADRGDIS